jgi:hypothetical protein
MFRSLDSKSLNEMLLKVKYPKYPYSLAVAQLGEKQKDEMMFLDLATILSTYGLQKLVVIEL